MAGHQGNRSRACSGLHMHGHVSHVGPLAPEPLTFGALWLCNSTSSDNVIRHSSLPSRRHQHLCCATYASGYFFHLFAHSGQGPPEECIWAGSSDPSLKLLPFRPTSLQPRFRFFFRLIAPSCELNTFDAFASDMALPPASRNMLPKLALLRPRCLRVPSSYSCYQAS